MMKLFFPIQSNAIVRLGLRLSRVVAMLFLSIAFAFATSTLVRAAPSITATLTDAFIGGDGDGKADPGETIEYTAIITNGGADPATGITFNDILDLNTTLVSGSINVSPLAGDDAYETIGNTLLEVGVAASGNPAVTVSGSIFDNDIEFLGDTFSLKSVEADITAPFTTATEQGGSVTVEANGSFSYIPAAGFSGTDNFDYVITDDGPDNIAGNSDDLTGAGRVTITVTTQRVWYVKNNSTPGGLGRSSDPFDTLAEAQTASAANDTIYVFAGSGTTTGQSLGITLKSGQRLLGEGVALTIPVSVNGGSNPTTLRAAGSQPQIDNTTVNGNGVSVNDISGVEIRGLNIGGNTNAIDVTTTAANGGSFEIANNTIRAAGLEGIDVNGGGSGTLTVSIHDNVVTATGNGIDVARTAGNVVVTAFDDNVVTGNTGGVGINVVGTGATILFDANSGTAAFDTVSGGVTVIGQSGNGVGASGIILNNIRGDLNFTDLDVFSDAGTALLVNGTSPNYTGTSGTRVVVGSGVSTLSANGGAAVDITDANANLVLLSLTSTNSTGSGVGLTRVSGTFTGPAGSAITNASGADVSINGGSNGSANVAFTYGGTITDDIGTLVQIQNVTATSALSFTGAITDDNDGDGSGISLTGNSGATITFSGGLLVSTGGNPAFTATGGGTINVCDENPCNSGSTGSLVNSLTTTSGTALNVTNTTIGSNNLEFRSISANGAANGIVLNATGGSGGLKVKGNGGSCISAGTCTGGAIQNTTGDGISLNDTDNVSLTRVFIGNTGGHGISGFVMADHTSGVNPTFEIRNSRVTSPGNADNETALYFGRSTSPGNNTGRLVVADTVVEQFEENGVEVYNNTGTLTVDVTGTLSGLTDSTMKFDDNNDTHGQQGVLITAAGTATITSNVSGVYFNNIEFAPLDIRAEGTAAVIDVNWIGNVSINGGGPDNFPSGGGFQVIQDVGGTATFDIKDNYIRDLPGDGIVVIAEGPTSGRIQNNVISGTSLGDGIRIDTDQLLAPGPQPGNNFTATILIENNLIGNDGTFPGIGDDGIQILHRDGTKTLNLTIQNNTIANTASEALRYFTDADITDGVNLPNNVVLFNNNTITNIGLPDSVYWQAQDSARLCLQMSGNSLPVAGNRNISVNQSGSGSLQVTQASMAALAAANPSSTQSSTGTITFNGICNPTLPSHTELPESQSVAGIQPDPKELASVIKTIDSTELEGQTPTDTLDALTAIDVQGGTSLGSGKPIFIPAQPVPAQSGETVNVSIGTLPAGKSVTIKYRVTVDPLDPGEVRTKISTQGTVSGSNFSNVSTANGGPADCETANDTCTPVDRPDTTVSSINRAASSPTNASSVSWTVTFADAVSGLTSSNFTLVNGGLGGSPAITGVTPVGGAPATQWTVTASSGTGSGTLGLNMTSDANLSHDVTNLNFTGQVYDIDRTAPTATINQASGQSDPAGASPINFTVVFSEAVTDFDDASDVTLSGTAGATTINITEIAPNDGTTYNVAVSGMTGDGTVIASVPSNVAQDNAGNNNTASSSTDNSVLYDVAPPSVTINQAAGQSDPTNASPINFTVVFSEPVTDFDDASDVTLSGTAGATTVNITEIAPNDGTTYNVAVSGMSADGTVIAQVPAAAAKDVANNDNGASTSSDNTVTYDATAPTVTIDQASGQSDPTGASPINFTVVFGEPVTDFNDASDVTLSGTAGATTINITEIAPNDGTTYNVAVSGMSGSGTVIAAVAIGAAQDNAGNNNTASTSSDNTVTYDGTAPTVTINQAAGQLDPTGTSPINFTVVFSEPVTDFNDASDVTLSGSAGATTVSIAEIAPTDGTTYNVEVSGMTGDGNVVANIPAGVAQDNVGNDNTASTSADNGVIYDTLVPSVTIDQALAQSDPTNASPINFTVVFSEDVTDFDDASDVTLSGTAAATTVIITGGPKTYNVAVSGMSSDGTVIAAIPAGAAQDISSQTNTASTSTDNMVTYDATPPAAPVVLTPANGSNTADNTPTVTGTAEPGSTVTVFIDSSSVGTTVADGFGDWSFTLTTLADGSYTVKANATDTAGNTSVDSNANTFTVDSTSPDTIIDTTPSNPTTSTSATFTFHGVDASSMTFECRLDGAGFTACTSPQNYPSLSEGSHTFQVRATDSLGNVDATPASYTWAIDSTPPDTVIDSSPADPTNATSANFTFHGVDASSGVSGMECRLDAGSFVACDTLTTQSYAGLGDGLHTFQVRATDNVSLTDPTPATYTWTVDTVIPDVTINQASTQNDPTSSSPVNFTAVFSEPVTGFTGGNVSLSGTAGATTAVVTETAPNDGTTYNVAVSGMTNIGTVIVSISANEVQDLAGNLNSASTSTDDTVTVNSLLPIFADVPHSHWANNYIERLYNAGITGGCGTSPLIFCPDDKITRAQMAVFMMRAIHGASYTPPPATGTVFADVPTSYWAAAWIEQFHSEGYTSGCGGGNYCPDQVATTRAQMAVFLLRGKYGTAYAPPAATGIFNDVPVSYWAAAWIEQLFAEGITSGCGGGNYCPNASLTRAEMAVFLVRAFNLP